MIRLLLISLVLISCAEQTNRLNALKICLKELFGNETDFATKTTGEQRMNEILKQRNIC